MNFVNAGQVSGDFVPLMATHKSHFGNTEQKIGADRVTEDFVSGFANALKDAFYRALQEQGHLDRFLLEEAEPAQFHSIREFEPGGELERQASEEYAAMSR